MLRRVPRSIALTAIPIDTIAAASCAAGECAAEKRAPARAAR
jgi:hypothetical protein